MACNRTLPAAGLAGYRGNGAQRRKRQGGEDRLKARMSLLKNESGQLTWPGRRVRHIGFDWLTPVRKLKWCRPRSRNSCCRCSSHDPYQSSTLPWLETQWRQSSSAVRRYRRCSVERKNPVSASLRLPSGLPGYFFAASDSGGSLVVIAAVVHY
jgi:hypothetical protein